MATPNLSRREKMLISASVFLLQTLIALLMELVIFSLVPPEPPPALICPKEDPLIRGPLFVAPTIP